jgi:hypothetical protein
VRPKSIAREMFERFMDFNEYVREYELGRAEGTLLRYLSDVYKALLQTVPAPVKTPEVEEIEVFLRAMVRAVDSSLLDEWERLRTGVVEERREVGTTEDVLGESDVTRDEKGFTVLVRNAMFQLLRALARKDWSLAASLVTGIEPGALEGAMAGFFADHASIRLDPAARAPGKTRVTPRDGVWDVVQVISDDAGDDDWAVFAAVDLEGSASAGKPVIKIERIAR